MRQYQVPQFITVEDKILGPLTLKQSSFLGVAAVLIFLARIFFQPAVFWPIAIIVGGFAAGLAFLKINGQPFWMVAKNALMYFIKPRVYIWKQIKPEKTLKKPEEVMAEAKITSIPKISESKLSDLAWSLDIKQELEQTREDKGKG
jgi:hypothetical protein